MHDDQHHVNDEPAGKESDNEQPDQTTCPVVDRERIRKEVEEFLESDVGTEMIDRFLRSAMAEVLPPEDQPRPRRKG